MQATLTRRNALKIFSAMAFCASLPTSNPLAQSLASAKPSLPTRTLGSGTYSMTVSALGFGAMGMSYNRGPAKDVREMARLLQQAADAGITLFDTAEIYGPHTNERLVGMALSHVKNINVTTKFGHKIVNGKYYPGELDSRPEQIRKVCEESLKRLQRETIDMFYQHRLDPNVPIEDVAGTVSDLIREGKVRHFGLCEVNADIIRRAHAVQPVTAIQSEYHLMWRTVEDSIFPTLEELGIGFVPYSPLNRGFLTGSITSERRFDPANDNRGSLPRFTPQALKANYAIVEAIRKFGQEHGNATPAQVALAWLLHKRPYIVPIPGTTVYAHFRENLGALSVICSNEDWDKLEQTLSAIPIEGDRYNAREQKQVS